MVEIVADAGRDEYGHVLDGQLVEQPAHVDEAVHHLRHAETVAEVVERIVAIVLLDTQLQRARTDTQAPSGDSLRTSKKVLLLLQPFNGLFSRTTWVSR